MVFYVCQGYGANLSSLPPIVCLRISLLADQFEGGCLLMVLMRAYNRWHYCLAIALKAKWTYAYVLGW